MKNMILTFVGFLLAAQTTWAINIPKINDAVKEILDQVSEQDDFVDGMSFYLDPEKTDPDKPSFNASITASTRQAPWFDGLTSLRATFDMDSELLQDSEEHRFFGKLSGNLGSDVVPMLKHFLTPKVCTYVMYMGPYVETTACDDMIEGIQRAESLNQQVMAFETALFMLKGDVNIGLNQIKALLESETDTDTDKKRELEFELAYLEDTLNNLELINVDNGDEATTISLSLNDFIRRYTGDKSELYIFFVFTSDSVEFGLDFDIYVNAEEAKNYIEIPREILQTLEQSTPESREELKYFALMYVEVLKDLVRMKDEN